MKTFSSIAFLTCWSLVATSCIRLVYGIKPPKPVSMEKIKAKAQKLHIDTTALYELNQRFFYQMYQWQQAHQNAVAKHRHQPLQVLYFDTQGEMVSQQLNCYAQGFPNLRWKRDRRMKVFPPISATAPDPEWKLQDQYRMIHQLNATLQQPDTSGYTVAVYWNSFMGRQTRRLLRIVDKNLLKAGNIKYQLLYINTDNYFVGSTPRK